jgi:hypothetical protein
LFNRFIAYRIKEVVGVFIAFSVRLQRQRDLLKTHSRLHKHFTDMDGVKPGGGHPGELADCYSAGKRNILPEQRQT